MNTTPSDLKYQIDEKLRVNMRLLPMNNPHNTLHYSNLSVRHDEISAVDIAALLALTATAAFNDQLTPDAVNAKLSKHICDGQGVTLTSGPLDPGTEFVVAIHTNFKLQQVGDKGIWLPTVKAVAYRPHVDDSSITKELYVPVPPLFDKHCRGVLELTVWQGTLLIQQSRGWLGSNQIVDWLREHFDAALAR